MTNDCCELAWLTAILKDHHIIVPLPIPLHCDNQTTLYIASNPMFHERTKHIKVDWHLVRDKLV